MGHGGAFPEKDGKNKTNALESTPNGVKRKSIALIQNLGVRETPALGLLHPPQRFRFTAH